MKVVMETLILIQTSILMILAILRGSLAAYCTEANAVQVCQSGSVSSNFVFIDTKDVPAKSVLECRCDVDLGGGTVHYINYRGPLGTVPGTCGMEFEYGVPTRILSCKDADDFTVGTLGSVVFRQTSVYAYSAACFGLKMKGSGTATVQCYNLGLTDQSNTTTIISSTAMPQTSTTPVTTSSTMSPTTSTRTSIPIATTIETTASQHDTTNPNTSSAITTDSSGNSTNTGTESSTTTTPQTTQTTTAKMSSTPSTSAVTVNTRQQSTTHTVITRGTTQGKEGKLAESTEEENSDVGTRVGVVFGVFIGVFWIAAIIIFCIRHKRKNQRPNVMTEESGPQIVNRTSSNDIAMTDSPAYGSAPEHQKEDEQHIPVTMTQTEELHSTEPTKEEATLKEETPTTDPVNEEQKNEESVESKAHLQ